MAKLDSEDIEAIIHDVEDVKLSPNDAARHNSVSVGLVYRIISTIRKEQSFIKRMKWAEMKKQQQYDAIVTETQKLLDNKTPIEAASGISQWILVTK